MGTGFLSPFPSLPRVGPALLSAILIWEYHHEPMRVRRTPERELNVYLNDTHTYILDEIIIMHVSIMCHVR
jgi:hypothetical protein